MALEAGQSFSIGVTLASNGNPGQNLQNVRKPEPMSTAQWPICPNLKRSIIESDVYFEISGRLSRSSFAATKSYHH